VPSAPIQIFAYWLDFIYPRDRYTPSPKGGKMTKPHFNKKQKEILDSFLPEIPGVVSMRHRLREKIDI